MAASKMYTHVNFDEKVLACRLPPQAVDMELHVRSAEGYHLFKTDIYQKKVSYMHPWTETFQPYEHVKRKIYKVPRKANRNPRVGYQISNGPGPGPWTRPGPYFRRTIISYPRTSIFSRPTFNRYSPYKRQTSPKKILGLPKVMDKDFVMQKFMASVQAFQDDDSSIPSLVTISEGPFSPEPSSLLAMVPTPVSTPAKGT